VAGNNLGTASGRIEVNTNDLKNADIALRSAGTSMINFGTQAVRAFAVVVGAAAAFEKEMDFVQAVTTASAEEMKLLEAAAINLAKNSVFGPIALSQAFVDLAKAGATVEQIINGVGEASVNLATAADVEIPFAGENLLNIMNTFKIGAEDAVAVTDMLAGAANASSVELSDIVTTMRYAGPVASAMGISIGDLNDAITILGKVGIKGSTAGTSLRFMMTRLVPDTDKAKAAITGLGLTIGDDGLVKEFSNADGSVRSFAEIMEVLRVATIDLNDQAKIAVVNDIFGVRAMPSALELMSQGAEGFAAINDEIQRTTAADVAAKRMDNLDGAIKRLKATVEAMFVEAGGPFQEMLKDWVNALRNVLLFIDALPGPFKTLIVALVGIIGVGSILSGVFILTIGNMVRAIRVVGELKNAFSKITTIMRATTAANGALSASFLVNPIFLMVAAIVALVAIFVILYIKVEGFRNFVNGVGEDIVKTWDLVVEKFKSFSATLDRFFSGFTDTWQAFLGAFNQTEGITQGIGRWIGLVQRFGNAIGIAFRAAKNFFLDLDDNVKRFAGAVADALGRAGLAVVNFVQDIPSKLVSLLGSFVSFGKTVAGAMIDGLQTAFSAFLDFLLALPGRVGFALGFIVGRFIRTFLYDIPKAVINGTTRVVKTMASWGNKLLNLVIDIFTKVVNKVLEITVALPGQILNILTLVLQTFIGWGTSLFNAAFSLMTSVMSSILSFIVQLPGMFWQFLTQTLVNIIGMIPQFASSASSLGLSFFNGIFDVITGMPSLVWGILTDVIGAFTDLVSVAFNAAKDFAGGLWNGFKDGLGINSPSFIEDALFSIQDQAKATGENLAGHLRTMQNLSTRIPAINSGAVGIASPASAALTANGGGLTIQNNAPLVGQATIRDERDAVTLSRMLADEQYRRNRAKGRS